MTRRIAKLDLLFRVKVAMLRKYLLSGLQVHRARKISHRRRSNLAGK